jgi:hypothetical protein
VRNSSRADGADVVRLAVVFLDGHQIPAGLLIQRVEQRRAVPRVHRGREPLKRLLGRLRLVAAARDREADRERQSQEREPARTQAQHPPHIAETPREGKCGNPSRVPG